MIARLPFSRGRFLLPAVICLAVVVGCKRDAAVAPVSTPANQIVDLGFQDVGIVASRVMLSGIHVTGSLNPSVRVEVKAQVAGQIDSVLVDRGTVVTQSQVMAVFDDRAIVAQVQSVKAQLAAAERDNAATELLYKAGASSERAFVNSKVGIDSAKAQLAQIQQNFDWGTVRSPIAGIISERLVSAGESAGPGQKLFTVVNSETLEFAATILPIDFASVKVGMKAVMTLDAFGNQKIEGRVTRMDPIADARSRQVGVYIDVPNKEGKWVAGLFASGTILTNSAADQKSILIPAGAVRDEAGESVVYVIDGGKLIRRPVSINRNGGEEGFVQVSTGLQEGEKIVISPSKELKAGTQVRILSASAP